jgi:hypothetical protein
VQDDPELDSVALRLTILFSKRVGRRSVDIELECLFLCAGWSATSLLRCSLVYYQVYRKEANEFQSQIATWEHNTSQILEPLL